MGGFFVMLYVFCGYLFTFLKVVLCILGIIALWKYIKSH